MKFAYQFSNLLGTVYRKGNLVFSPDGNSLISPVGNRISVFDLKNNKATTLPVESSYNYTTLTLSPDGNILLAVNEEGEAHLISLICRRIIHRYHFGRPVTAIKFSPDGKYFAACKENKAMVFRAPSLGEFGAFSMERVLLGALDDTTCLDWSSDSKVLAVGSSDMAVRLYAIGSFKRFKMYTLGSGRDALLGVSFERDSFNIISACADGCVFRWECNVDPDQLVACEPPAKRRPRNAPAADDGEDDVAAPRGHATTTDTGALDQTEEEDGVEKEGEKLRYRLVVKRGLAELMQKRQGEPPPRMTATAYHKQTRILVTGFDRGSFFVHEMPDVNLIHSLNICDQPVTSISLNVTGDWIGLGSSALGQLLVWEWQSETYVMKQQGHFNNMSCIAYSGDGQYVVTGGEDGKVKLWNMTTGFCFVTFGEHTAAVADVVFSNNRKFVLSAALDGTVRAYDLTRYRNFRTFASPQPVQFSCLALDSSNEFVAAGGQDVFEIFLWSMKLGRLVEILSGHEGPVSSVIFSPSATSSAMASVSWDGTLRLWDALESGATHETLRLSAVGLAAAWSPDAATVAAATLDGSITFFDVRTSQQVGSIEGRKDLGAALLQTDVVSAKKNLESKAFTSLCYSADGTTILAGGVSKNVCIYSTEEFLLVRKLEISHNRSFDGIDDFVNRRKMTEWGNAMLVQERDEADKLRLPGVRRGNLAARAFRPEIRVYSLKFSPTGQGFAAATTEGLLIYSLAAGLWFDPFHLDMAVTPDAIRQALARGENALALASAVRLNEANVTQEVVEGIPIAEVELTLATLPTPYVPRVLRFVAAALETTRHLDLYVRWARWLLVQHGAHLAGADVMPTLLNLQKNLVDKHESLAKICDYNKYTIRHLIRIGRLRTDAKKSALLAGEDAEAEEPEIEQMELSSEDDEDMLMYA